MHRDLAVQHTHKLEALVEALTLANVSFPAPRLFAHGVSLGYRNRLRLRVDERGAAVFFNPNKLPTCAVLQPTLASAVAQLQGLGALGGLIGAKHLELRTGDDRRVALCVYAGAPLPEAARSELRRSVPADWIVGFAGDARMPSLRYYLEEKLGAGAAEPLSYLVPISSFVQVNSAVNRALVAQLRRLVRDSGLESFCDLFCGAGNFTLPLLADGLSGESIEVDAHAIRALAAAVAGGSARSGHHVARAADARLAIESLEPRELLLANPPRAGLKLHAGGAARFASRAARCLALCSCSPQSLARDLAQILPCGFDLRELLVFDMFPHTRHLETLAWLERR